MYLEGTHLVDIIILTGIGLFYTGKLALSGESIVKIYLGGFSFGLDLGAGRIYFYAVMWFSLTVVHFGQFLLVTEYRQRRARGKTPKERATKILREMRPGRIGILIGSLGAEDKSEAWVTTISSLMVIVFMTALKAWELACYQLLVLVMLLSLYSLSADATFNDSNGRRSWGTKTARLASTLMSGSPAAVVNTGQDKVGCLGRAKIFCLESFHCAFASLGKPDSVVRRFDASLGSPLAHCIRLGTPEPAADMVVSDKTVSSWPVRDHARGVWVIDCGQSGQIEVGCSAIKAGGIVEDLSKASIQGEYLEKRLELSPITVTVLLSFGVQRLRAFELVEPNGNLGAVLLLVSLVAFAGYIVRALSPVIWVLDDKGVTIQANRTICRSVDRDGTPCVLISDGDGKLRLGPLATVSQLAGGAGEASAGDRETIAPQLRPERSVVELDPAAEVTTRNTIQINDGTAISLSEAENMT